MNRKGYAQFVFWIVVVIPLFIINIIPIVYSLITVENGSPYAVFLIFAIQPITGICLILGIIDLVFALVIHKTQSKAIFLSIFGGLYICLGILGHGLMRTIEIPSVNLEDGITYISECAVTQVSYDHNSEQGNMYFESGKVPLHDHTHDGLVTNILNVSGIVKYHETGVRIIEVRDVKRFVETGYAVKDRCGYEFGGWVDGIEWFMKNTRT